MKRSLVAVWGGVGLVGSLLGGCGGTSSKQVDGGAAAACTDYITKYCDQLQACAPGALAILGYTSLADCVSSYLPGCTGVLAAPHTGDTLSLIQQCGDAIAAQSCTQFLQSGSVAACAPHGGTIPNGGSCSSAWQCASGRCSMLSIDACGTCVAAVSAGQPCENNSLQGSACANDLVCAVTTPGSTTPVCTTPVAMGGACADPAVCPFNATCDGTSHLCAQLPAVGQACDPSIVFYCDPTKAAAFCDSTTSLCEAAAAAQPGAACSTDTAAYVPCNGVCETTGDADVGVCSRFVVVDKACGVTDVCVVGAACTAGVCTTVLCDGLVNDGAVAAAPAIAGPLAARALDRRRAVRLPRTPFGARLTAEPAGI